MKQFTIGFIGLCLALVSFTAGVKTHEVIYSESKTFSDVKPIFKQRCYICHNANSGRGDWTDYKQVFKKKDVIKLRLETKNMPPGNATRMTEEERSEILTWIKEGAKE